MMLQNVKSVSAGRRILPEYTFTHNMYICAQKKQIKGRQNRQHHQQHIKLSQKPLKINEINCKINEKQASKQEKRGLGHGTQKDKKHYGGFSEQNYANYNNNSNRNDSTTLQHCTIHREKWRKQRRWWQIKSVCMGACPTHKHTVGILATKFQRSKNPAASVCQAQINPTPRIVGAYLHKYK